MGTAKLVVLGSINADHILNVKHFPQPGETVRGDHYQVAFGGKGANQAVAAGRSGADITFIACVGDDDIGASIKNSYLSITLKPNVLMPLKVKRQVSPSFM